MICAQKLSSKDRKIKKPRVMRSFRFSKEELEALEKRAEAYFNGDISGWVRFAASLMTPDESQIRAIKASDEESRILK